ncbi:MAG: YggS family pyridoxal phosphate-dependent enzyme [Candidatus Omnitrophica bacterium CG02_land_8_20_14_3_00__42_8]|nr:MAG: YggS family pyridoxal phosphate-dependent enzyme [Candidatus Omnitrophica bacterium CG02_land_8_20_14_3_00__42_8]PIW68811.1 MAG: YggS family pyridoxal phosphate-dependent enzyme [Candidatus Omnitrophica bacterium CG12_big_fil_rev_8_21_14_0_65_42_8]
MAGVKDNVLKILSWLPGYVELVAAAKGRRVEEVLEAIDNGVRIIGENYLQESEEKFSVIGAKAKWHFIGHLQKNKVKKAIKIFDVIETIDSIEIAEAIDKASAAIGKVMEVFIEVNSAREKNKSGVLPEGAEALARHILELKNIKLTGLMTMGPVIENPEGYRPYFKETKKLFDKIRITHDIKYLSMGMSDSYHIAVQEGANLVRIGTAIFGPS